MLKSTKVSPINSEDRMTGPDMEHKSHSTIHSGSPTVTEEADLQLPAAAAAAATEEKATNDWHVQLVHVFEGAKGMFVMTLATFFALYCDDFRLAVTDKDSDVIFNAISTICLVMFAVEFTAFCMAKKKFLWGFFFWLDMVAVLSMVPDIPFLWEPIYEGLGGDASSAASEDLTVARAGRASRAGTKAGRLVRFIRIIRLIRVVKLYKYCGKNRKKGDEEEEEETVEQFSSALGGSKVGAQVGEFATRKVILGVLLMLFAFPLLEVPVVDSSAQYGLFQLQAFKDVNATNQYILHQVPVSEAYWAFSVEQFQDNHGATLLKFVADYDEYYNDVATIDGLRDVEMKKLYSKYSEAEETRPYVAWLNTKAASQDQALLNMVLTTFVIFLLGYGAMQFAKDANEAVIHPIERMVKFVQNLSANPLGKITLEKTAKKNEFETALLEETLTKLAGLLQIGFGDAGADIIAKNLTAGKLNTKIPGDRITAIFGFCDIRQFDKCTSCLQREVMLFVNQIADIVHERVHYFNGYANKNIGNAFVLVWKFNKHKQRASRNFGTGASIIKTPVTIHASLETEQKFNQLNSPNFGNGGFQKSPVTSHASLSAEQKLGLAASSIRVSDPAVKERNVQNGTVEEEGLKGDPDLNHANIMKMFNDPEYSASMTSMADQALLSFLHTIVEVAHNPDLERWKQHPALLQKFGTYDISMGYGLHVGWAIEGAIGSTHKIDASYLSPNVNMAARLEAATKQFGVRLLMSGSFYALLQPAIQKRCRHLDRVTVKGSLVPIDLWTCDLNPTLVDPSAENAFRKKTETINMGERANTVYVDGPKPEPGPLDVAKERLVAAARSMSLSSNRGSIEDAAQADKLSKKKKKKKGVKGARSMSIDRRKSRGTVFLLEGDNESMTPQERIAMLDQLQAGIPEEFISTFNMATAQYIAGEWKDAKATLDKVAEMNPDDVPMKILLGVMGDKYNFKAPKTGKDKWYGFRALTKK